MIDIYIFLFYWYFIDISRPKNVFLLQTRFFYKATTHLYTNMKPNLLNVVLFILKEQNGSYVIR